MKKFLTVALACCIAVTGCVAFAACGGGTDYDHTIIFYSSQGQNLTPTTDKAIENFEAKYPGWKVEHTQPGGYDEVLSKVRSDLTAGLQPDLAYCYSDHVAQYIESGTVVNMSEFLTKADSYTYTYKDDSGAEQTKTIDRIGFTQEDVDAFIPRFMNEGYAKNYTGASDYGFKDDDLLTLPFVKSTELLYYNPDALTELGVSELPKEFTWDDLWAICADARAKWNKCTPLGYDSEANWFITMAQQLGFDYTSADANNHYLFNNDGAKAWLTDIQSKYKEPNKYITTQQIYGSYTSALFILGPQNNGLVFCIGSSGGANNQAGQDFVTEVAPIPGVYRDADGDGTDEFHAECISQGPSLVMLRGGHSATNPDEKEIMTFQFIKELLDVEFQAKFSRVSGYNPMRTDVNESENFQLFLAGKDEEGKALNGSSLVASKAVKVANDLNSRFFTSPAFVGSSVARAQMTSVVQYVLLGQKSVNEALEGAIKACGGNLS